VRALGLRYDLSKAQGFCEKLAHFLSINRRALLQKENLELTRSRPSAWPIQRPGNGPRRGHARWPSFSAWIVLRDCYICSLLPIQCCKLDMIWSLQNRALRILKIPYIMENPIVYEYYYSHVSCNYNEFPFLILELSLEDWIQAKNLGLLLPTTTRSFRQYQQMLDLLLVPFTELWQMHACCVFKISSIYVLLH
jgi:hypothetical protein